MSPLLWPSPSHKSLGYMFLCYSIKTHFNIIPMFSGITNGLRYSNRNSLRLPKYFRECGWAYQILKFSFISPNDKRNKIQEI
jgi:hypothetical protein